MAVLFNDPNSKFSPELLTALGAGLLSGNTWNEQLANAGMGANTALAAQQQKQQEAASKNQTVAFLQANAPDLASNVASNAIDSKTALAQYWERQKAQTEAAKPQFQKFDDGSYGWINPADRSVDIAGRINPIEKPTDDQREYDMAKKQGFEGTFFDYMVKMKEAGRTKVDIDTGEKLPAGFRWKDTNKKELGVEPIPGGPGEQVPGELAARVGLAENFQRQLPNIQEKVKQGAVTGVFDRAWAGWVGTGEGAETYRQIQSGVDSLQRLLTGAGMNIAEAQNYSQRYLPSYTDDAQTVISKLNQLSQELESAKSMAMRGRGGDQPQQNNTPSVDDLVKKYGKP